MAKSHKPKPKPPEITILSPHTHTRILITIPGLAHRKLLQQLHKTTTKTIQKANIPHCSFAVSHYYDCAHQLTNTTPKNQ